MKKTIASFLLAGMLVLPGAAAAQVAVPDYSGWTQEQRDAKLMELLTLVIQLLQQLAVLQAQEAARAPVPVIVELVMPQPAPVPAPVVPEVPEPGVGASELVQPVLRIGNVATHTAYPGGNCSSVSVPVELTTGGTIVFTHPETGAQVYRTSPAVFTYTPQVTNTARVLTFSASSTENVSITVPIGPSHYENYLQGSTPEAAAAAMDRSGQRYDASTGKCL